ncbi:MAG TPA: hypothetical protein VJB59_15890 [Bdellovibrionota bacterium]|nr:hypothetical protein [Bdellovibrionota bacterium]
MRTVTLLFFFVSFLSTQDAHSFGSAKSKSQPAPNQEFVWVVRDDGAKKCSGDSGESLEQGARELTKAKVNVQQSRKGSDGKMHMEMCGAPAGTVNGYLIPKADLPTAIERGFKLAAPGFDR